MESHFGSESYIYVDALIKERSNSLEIISPYISLSYARMLSGESARKRIRIITSANSIEAVEYLKRNSKASIFGDTKAMLFAILLFAIAYYIKFFYIAFLLLFVIVALALWIYLKAKRNTNRRLEVKVSAERFIHEKAYISDLFAIAGSANLTYSGMHKNIERIEVIDDLAEVEKMRRHFNSLWESI